jgi:hypothetical protein
MTTEARALILHNRDPGGVRRSLIKHAIDKAVGTGRLRSDEAGRLLDDLAAAAGCGGTHLSVTMFAVHAIKP